MIRNTFSSPRGQIIAFIILILVAALFLWIGLHFAFSVTSGLLEQKPPV